MVRRVGCAKSNRTDNESAKMATDKGVIQGYTGVAAVDAKHQIIVEAQAHGTGSEQELLLPVVEGLATFRHSATVLTADAGYHSEANLAALVALDVPALIADPDMRKRDERFADREHHTTAPNPLHDKSGTTKKALPLFASSDSRMTPTRVRACVPPESRCIAPVPPTYPKDMSGRTFGCEARLRAVCVARPMFANTNDHRRSQRRLFSRARGCADCNAYDAHAAAP